MNTIAAELRKQQPPPSEVHIGVVLDRINTLERTPQTPPNNPANTPQNNPANQPSPSPPTNSANPPSPSPPTNSANPPPAASIIPPPTITPSNSANQQPPNSANPPNNHANQTVLPIDPAIRNEILQLIQEGHGPRQMQTIMGRRHGGRTFSHQRLDVYLPRPHSPTGTMQTYHRSRNQPWVKGESQTKRGDCSR